MQTCACGVRVGAHANDHVRMRGNEALKYLKTIKFFALISNLKPPPPPHFRGQRFSALCQPLSWRKWAGGEHPHFDACFVKWVAGQNLDILSRSRKCASFLGLFGRKSSHKSPNFLRSRLSRSRNFFLAVPCLLVREKFDVPEDHGFVSSETDVQQSLG